MAYFISGLILLLVAAIISINHKNRKIKELKEDCKELNEDLQTVSTLACTTENRNTMLQEKLDFAENRLDDLQGPIRECEGENVDDDIIDTAPTTAKELDDAVFYSQAISKKPETNQQAFERVWQEMRAKREANGIYSNLTKGKR